MACMAVTERRFGEYKVCQNYVVVNIKECI